MTRTTAPRLLTAAFLALGLAGGLAGCAPLGGNEGQPVNGASQSDVTAAPLQSYVDANQNLALQEMERYSDIYSDFTMEAEGSSTLVYRYTFREQVDADQFKSQMGTMADTLGATAEVIFDEMESVGVANPVVRWMYHNADSALIDSYEYSR